MLAEGAVMEDREEGPNDAAACHVGNFVDEVLRSLLENWMAKSKISPWDGHVVQ